MIKSSVCFKSDTLVKSSGLENVPVFLSTDKAYPTRSACSEDPQALLAGSPPSSIL